MMKVATILATIALAAFGFAACGGDDDEEDTTAAETTATETTAGGGGGTTLDISAPEDGSFAFDQKSLNATAGTATINFDNPAAVSHDVVLEAQGGEEVGKTPLVSEGQESFTADLKPGTYTFYCPVGGHEAAGMKGTLTVE
jgi:plastocyanin